MLFRSPVKTVLTVLLLTAAAFLLLDNLSSYAMQTEAVKQAEEAAAQFLGFLRDERFACLRELPGFQMVQTGVGKIAKES
jgi:hypothetical protein